ncbi:MAG TPA: TonB-dependent receptor [Bryobacteraceae bacterium]|nr:TonB-dependent receptor [Bryobacteraceae bacterium]
MQTHRWLVGVMLALGVAAPAVYAQTESAFIVGTVTDSSGALMPSVTVTIRDTRTNIAITVQTAADGNYASPPLQPGPYSVSVETTGFAKTTQNINLDVAQHARLDFSMKPGQVTESVVVEANAAMLDTQTAELSNVRTAQAVNDLPLNGRDFMVLTYLTPGTSSSGTGYTMSRGASNQLGLQGVSVNGIRNGDSTEYFDGIQSQDNEYGAMILLPTPDAIQEFKMQTSDRDATTGRTGGAAVNLITKSGGNEFHGTGFEFLRNSDFDARNYFDPPQIPAFHQNQFGGSLGGPIKKNKTFFFVDVQKSYTIQGQSFLQTVPLTPEITGNFSALKSIIYNPYSTSTTNGVTTRQPFANNIIPPSMISPIGQAIMNLYPAPNLPGTANNYGYNPPRTLAPIQGDLRIDQHFTDNDSFFARFSAQRSGTIVNPGYFPQYSGGPIFPGNYTTAGTQGVVGYTHVFSPTFLADFRAGYSRIDNTGVNFNQGSNFMDQIGIPGIDGYGYQWQAVGVFSITGASTVGGTGNIPFVKATNNKQFSWHFNWIHDRHSIKWGYDLFRRGMNTVQMGAPSGSFSFTGQFTQNPASPSGTGSGLADTLLGLDASASLSVWQETGTRRWEHGMFVQDDYRITNKLTLNLGLRYELTTPWTEIHNRLANFVPALDNVYPAGSPQYPMDTMYNANYLDFEPRIGLAYQLTSKTVLRAGYGIFYDFTSESVNSLGNNNAPFAGNLAITNNVTGAVTGPGTLSGVTPLSVGFLPYQPIGNFGTLGTSVSWFPLNDPDAMVRQGNVSIQQQVTSDTVLTVAYVSTGGEHLTIYPNINQPVPGPGAANPRREYPLFSSISEISHGESSSYNALQATLDRRFSHGLAFLASYAWGHALDITSTTASGGVQNPLCELCDRGPADFDIRQSMVLSWSYELPFGKGKWIGNDWSKPVDYIFGGWKFNSIDTFQSGSPFTVNSGTNTEGSGGGTQRANVIGNWHVPDPGPSLWFNPNAFTAPPSYTYGDTGRNIIVGPGTNEIDLSLFKNFVLPWREGMRLEFRAEAFNLFNKPQFDNPNESGATAGAATIGVAGVGTLNYAGNPAFFQRTSREIQLAMKLYF